MTGFVPKRLLTERALKLLLLGLSLVVPKRPFADGASDVVVLDEPKPEKVARGNVTLGASLLAVVPKIRPVELGFEVGSLANMESEPNRPPFGVAFGTPLLEDVAFEPNRFRDGDLDVSLLGDTPLALENIPNVDEESVFPNRLLLGGVWVDALLMEDPKFEPKRPVPRDPVLS